MRNSSLNFNRIAKSILLGALFSFAFSYVHAQDIKAGESLFKQKCTACHAINTAVVGPALKDVTKTYDSEFLHSWISNSMAFAAENADAQALADSNPAMMPAFPELAVEDIDNILAYIDAESAAPADGGSTGAEGGEVASGNSGDVSGFMLGGLIAVLVIALLVIVVLNRVIKTLEKVLDKNKDIIQQRAEAEEPQGPSVGDKLKALAKNKKLVFFSVLMLIVLLSTVGWRTMWNIGVHEGYQPVQPIKFSHQLHAGINQIDCQYCHSGASKSKNASIPSLNVCMNCHNHVTASEKYAGEISPEIQKIYTAIDWDPATRTYGDNQKPIEWVRIHNLPDFAYFNHSQHVQVAGVECQRCHGPIETMEEVYQYAPLTMKWCVECHQETEVNYKDNEYYDQLIAAHEQLKQGETVTPALLGGLECGKCHY